MGPGAACQLQEPQRAIRQPSAAGPHQLSELPPQGCSALQTVSPGHGNRTWGVSRMMSPGSSQAQRGHPGVALGSNDNSNSRSWLHWPDRGHSHTCQTPCRAPTPGALGLKGLDTPVPRRPEILRLESPASQGPCLPNTSSPWKPCVPSRMTRWREVNGEPVGKGLQAKQGT